ncbi:MAG TPA: flavodoxin family protein, partial [Candidatus Methanoperedenaceae archaeon]|nr:flavodoxin family protein [Candidatus Methanoperedenaceae archaeon]
ELALQSVLNFYIINEMIPVGGGSFGANMGGTFWSKDRLEEGVREDEEGLRSMRRTVDRLVKTAAMLKKARGLT